MKKLLLFILAAAFSLSISFAQQKKMNEPMIQKSLFGKMKDGKEVYEYTLHNKRGAEIKIITYGARVVSLTMPDRKGKYADIVLGYDNLQSYVKSTDYFGSIVGRYANRIGKAEITLNGKTYKLSANENGNELHGGKMGFSEVVWNAKPHETKAGPALELTLISPDGDQGYPGKMTVHVTYTLLNNNELKIQYEATTNKETVINLSHHSYFNLSGDPHNTILNELLKINANEFTPIDKESIPTGKIEKVAGTPLDFRKPTAIGARINDNFEQLKLAHGYDFNYVLNNYNGKVREVADVYDPSSGRYMQVFTDQPGIQFYSGNYLNGTQIGKDGIAYQQHAGLCLEAQHYPDSPHEPKWPSVILKPGQVYHQTTIYKFSTKK